MFTQKIAKPRISESFALVGKPKASETYTKIAKPSISGSWTKVRLETAPASNLSDIAEADVAVVDDSNSLPNLSV